MDCSTPVRVSGKPERWVIINTKYEYGNAIQYESRRNALNAHTTQVQNRSWSCSLWLQQIECVCLYYLFLFILFLRLLRMNILVPWIVFHKSHVFFCFSMRDFAEEDVKPRLFRKPVNRGSHDWRRTFSLDFSFPFVRLLASGYWVS